MLGWKSIFTFFTFSFIFSILTFLLVVSLAQPLLALESSQAGNENQTIPETSENSEAETEFGVGGFLVFKSSTLQLGGLILVLLLVGFLLERVKL